MLNKNVENSIVNIQIDTHDAVYVVGESIKLTYNWQEL